MTKISTLRTELEASRQRAATGQYFIARAVIRSLFSEDNIAAAVKDLSIDEEDRIGLAAKIFDQGSTLFAILIWMQRENSIVAFRQHNILDANLPLEPAGAIKIAPEFGNLLASEVQWEFLPYTFPKDMCDCYIIIRDQEILPFISEQYLTSGGFGDIYKMTVLRNQQEFFPSTVQAEVNDNPIIIRKRLKIRPKLQTGVVAPTKLYEKEMRCLRLLHRLRHPNIVRPLGFYTYKGEHNFLFPCYDKDLSAFFRLENRMGGFEWDHSFFAALSGLASALQNVHQLNLNSEEHGLDFASIGYHHDLRPENILVDNSRFLLADFGLAKLKDPNAFSETNWKAGAGDYVAPECMNQEFAHQRVGRGIDIWAFGCLLAEVATYIERGSSGIVHFEKLRLSAEFDPHWSDHYFFSKDGLKLAVSEWLRDLASSPRNKLISRLVQLAFSILQKDPNQRPTAQKIRQSLAALSIAAHFRAVRQEYEDYFVRVCDDNEAGISVTQLWFEKARFNAMGWAFEVSLEQDQISELLQVENLHDKSTAVFVSLFKVLHLRSVDISVKHPPSTKKVMESTRIDIPYPVEDGIHLLVQALWDLFPIKYRNKMENIYLQRLLDTEHAKNNLDRWSRYRFDENPEYAEVSALAAMKSLRLQLVHRQVENTSCAYLKERDDMKYEADASGHSVGLYKGDKQVLIEWEYYSPKWKVSEKGTLMSLKAEGFGVTPKPSKLRILDCIGVVEQGFKKHGYGFMYAFPSQVGHGEPIIPVTLFDLLMHDYQAKSKVRQPPLKEKFVLASKLVSCLMEFHIIGWLHKNINSNNILFFNVDIDSGLIANESFHDPYLVDYRQCRPDSEVWHTEGPADVGNFKDYRHPEYVDESRYNLVYDYYSLGLVLLEIGLWTPLQYWSTKYRKATPKELRNHLVGTYAPRLGPRMGEVYRDAVLACLNGDVGGPCVEGAVTEGHGLSYFAEKVMEPIDGLARLAL